MIHGQAWRHNYDTQIEFSVCGSNRLIFGQNIRSIKRKCARSTLFLLKTFLPSISLWKLFLKSFFQKIFSYFSSNYQRVIGESILILQNIKLQTKNLSIRPSCEKCICMTGDIMNLWRIQIHFPVENILFRSIDLKISVCIYAQFGIQQIQDKKGMQFE